jgi:hypothetical protein
MKCKTPNEKGRESFDQQLAKLAPDARMMWLIYGDKEAANPARRLAAQAQALRGLKKVLGARFDISEGYNAACAELQRCAGELCAQALLAKDESFFKQIAAKTRKDDAKLNGPSTAHTIRLILMHEAKNGPVNLSRVSAGLKQFWGITIDGRSLGRIAHRLEIPTLLKGRPRKLGTLESRQH